MHSFLNKVRRTLCGGGLLKGVVGGPSVCTDVNGSATTVGYQDAVVGLCAFQIQGLERANLRT